MKLKTFILDTLVFLLDIVIISLAWGKAFAERGSMSAADWNLCSFSIVVCLFVLIYDHCSIYTSEKVNFKITLDPVHEFAGSVPKVGDPYKVVKVEPIDMEDMEGYDTYAVWYAPHGVDEQCTELVPCYIAVARESQEIAWQHDSMETQGDSSDTRK